MGRCGVYEEMYLRTGTGTKPANNLEGEIVKLYSSVLQYFVWAKQYFQKNTAGSILAQLVPLHKWFGF